MKITFILFIALLNLSFAGEDWVQKFPTSSPSGRDENELAYISINKTVLFGGITSLPYVENDETWVFDLSENNWTKKNPTVKPAARRSFGLAHIGDDQVLLFGGIGSGIFGDTWIYDLSDNLWTLKSPPTSPSKRDGHSMAYINDNEVLLFGGNAQGNNDETWIFNLNANNWFQRTPSSKPSPRSGFDMAYIGDNKVLLFGGNTGINSSDETWIFDRSQMQWYLKSPQGAVPSPRYAHKMAYIGDDKVILYGGYDGGANDETWIYDLSDNTWTKDLNATQPSARYGHALSETSMDGSSYLVLFGGGYNDETWTFGGGDYSLPVELTSLSAISEDGKITLKWFTESEIDNTGFEIERAAREFGNYQTIASYRNNPALQGQGNSTQRHEYLYADRNVHPGAVYWYKLVDVDYNGNKTYHGPLSAVVGTGENSVTKISSQLADNFKLYPNYPNPFNPITNIKFAIPSLMHNAIHATLTVYNALGQKIDVLYDGDISPGNYSLKWRGTGGSGDPLPGGIYYAVLQTDRYTDAIKMVLMK